MRWWYHLFFSNNTGQTFTRVLNQFFTQDHHPVHHRPCATHVTKQSAKQTTPMKNRTLKAYNTQNTCINNIHYISDRPFPFTLTEQKLNDRGLSRNAFSCPKLLRNNHTTGWTSNMKRGRYSHNIRSRNSAARALQLPAPPVRCRSTPAPGASSGWIPRAPPASGPGCLGSLSSRTNHGGGGRVSIVTTDTRRSLRRRAVAAPMSLRVDE